MLNDIELLIDTTRKASKFLQRDFFELENLQSTSRDLSVFHHRAYEKALGIVHECFEYISKPIITDTNEVLNEKFNGDAFLVEILSDQKNFQRSIPFFGIMITEVTKKNTNDKIEAHKCVIYFPSSGEMYYTQKGKGSWVQSNVQYDHRSSRIRVSANNNIQEAVCSVSSIIDYNLYRDIQNIMVFNSYIFSLSLLIRGKIDAFILPYNSLASFGSELFILESGGQFFVKDKKIAIGSNLKLYETIKHMIS